MTPQSPTLASQATAELPKLPLPFTDACPVGWAYDQPCDDPMPDLYSEYQMNAHYLAGYEAGRASRAQSEPSHQVAVREASIPPGYIGEHVALKRLLDRSDELPLHAHKRKIVRDWIEAEIEAVDDAARASLVQQPATLGETK